MIIEEKLKAVIRDIHDFPKPGIIFKDITPVFANPALVREVVREMAETLKSQEIDAIAAVEARGFIFGAILAHELNCRFIPVRKAGKLPYNKKRKEYDLEYGKAAIEMHTDAIQPGWKVLVHDDVLATGGTASATAELIREMGGTLAGFSFLVNLSFLNGEANLLKHFNIKPSYLVSY